MARIKGGISVKRLTSKRIWEEAKSDLKHEMGYSHIWKRLAEIENILGDDGDDYDLDRLKKLLEKDRNGAFDPYSKFPEKGQEVWYWDSKNGISRGIVDFVNIDFCDNSLNEFGVDFPDENDFDIFAGSAWGTRIVASKETALEKMKEGK